MNIYHTKIVPPRLSGIVARERLFGLLDEKNEYPITWVASPAGSGKTTLVASYLKVRKLPAIWYRVDESDGDVAGFFYYMGEAAKKLKRGRAKPLPLFTQEFRFGITAFTRHYFTSLFDKMIPPSVIVFDNYQEVPEDAELHEVLRNGIKLAPDGIRIFLLSRKEFPPPYISLKADSMLTTLGWEDIRFTVDEVRDMVFQRKHEAKVEEMVSRIHEETQGWAAAVILMLDQKELPSFIQQPVGHSSIFRYFSVEVFHGLEDRIKDFLCITSLLPSITPDVATALTGVSEASSILSHLNNNNYFTNLYGEGYHYHPLFKEFLVNETKKRFAVSEIVSFIKEAAYLLAQSGQREPAIRLLFDANAFREVLPLMLDYAPMLLIQGRTATLEEWAGRLPLELRDSTPWLSYWLGTGKLIANANEAKKLLEKAFCLFEAQGDNTGCLLAAARIINSILFPWDDYRNLDRWIEWIDQNVDAQNPLPVPEIEAQVASAMVQGLTWRKFWHPNMKIWIERALAASRKVEDPSVRLAAKGHVMEYYGFMGHWDEMRLVAEEFRQTAVSLQASPMIHLAHMLRIIETHDWIHGSWDDTFQRLQEVLYLAQNVGAYIYIGAIYMHGVWICYEMKNLALAEDFLRKMEQSAYIEEKLGRAFYHCMNAMFFIQKNDQILALQNAQNAVNASVEVGVPMLEAWSRVAFAYALRIHGEKKAARDQLAIVEKIVAPAGITHTLYLLRLTQASLFFNEGDALRGRKALKEAFRIGKEKGYGMTLYWFWQPDEMSHLCSEAIYSGIEAGYAIELITKCSLKPSTSPERLLEWPIPYKIKTLGHFEILVNEKPLAFSGKVQKKPLSLLKALASFGGRDVREEYIEDEIWPEADGDVARIALKTNLSRLRRLLGNERVIEVSEGKMSFNDQLVWIDTWAFESLVRRVSKLWDEQRQGKYPEEVDEIAGLLLRIYHGEFMPGEDEPWAEPYRERLRSSFLRATERLAQIYLGSGERKKAAGLREKAIDRGISPKEILF